jgi:hypothetical protein
MIMHDSKITGSVNEASRYSGKIEPTGKVCVLLKDGRLFGVFKNREAASYWAEALELDAFSTYDMLPITDLLK